jgi:hypothetical protein
MKINMTMRHYLHPKTKIINVEKVAEKGEFLYSGNKNYCTCTLVQLL